MKLLGHWTSKFIVLLVLACNCLADVAQLNNDNLNDMLKTKMMMVNFYADWCRFSRMLEPVFKEAAAKAAEEFGDVDVKFARADCDKEQSLCQKYSVSKYPTIKLLRDGVPMKKEYRGQRTAEAITQFIRDQLKSPVTEVKNLDEIYELNRDKRTIVGYFENKQNVQYANFDLIANLLKDDCQFYAAIGELSKPERSSGDNVVFKPDKESEPEMVFLGSLANKELLQAWIQDKCVPLVREITFQNGEELTEEGLPFMILFHTKEDTESLERYTKEVSRLVSFKSQINFLVADCQTFSHPLHHLGKSVQDCPLLAIDSFRHMYMFPDFKEVNEPGKLKQFILDLQSGKLHREFHHGPDKPEGQKDAPKNPAQTKAEKTTEEATTPPESVFKNLKPSEHRYTLRDRDEL